MPKRKCLFTSELQKKYPAFRKGREEWEASCRICSFGTFVSVANKGAIDLEAHLKTSKHQKSVRSGHYSTTLSNCFAQPGSRIQNEISAGEGALAFHTVKHHFSYLSMDCTPGLTRQICNDSEIAKKMTCARTKTEAIVNSIIAPYGVEIVIEAMKNISHFGVSTDASNHGAVKMFPLLIQYFDWKNGGLQTKVIDLQSLPNETADTIATFIKDALDKHDLGPKCVAFSGDNCNTNFGGIRRGDGNNVFANLKRSLNPNLIGIGCPAHILNNCVHHGVDRLSIDIESIVLKIFNYFSIYTVRTEALKEFAEFVEVQYKPLLYHSKTRWLSLFPAVERLLTMFAALKSYFLSQDKIPVVIEQFFKNEISEISLWFVHSLMSVFHCHIASIEREGNSLAEVMGHLESVMKVLRQRKEHAFLPIKVKQLLLSKRAAGFEEECNAFTEEVADLYTCCIDYLQAWTNQILGGDLYSFKWMCLAVTPKWEDVEATVLYLTQMGILIRDGICFDQFCVLKKFCDDKTDDEDYKALLAHEKWCRFFQHGDNTEYFSELLKVVEFFLAIPSHNANVERVFSLIQSQWSKERNKLSIESIKAIAITQYNFSHMSCTQFHKHLLSNQSLLQKISSAEKYLARQ